jgi:cytochrome c5
MAKWPATGEPAILLHDDSDGRSISALPAVLPPESDRGTRDSATMTTKSAGAMMTVLVLAVAGLCRAADDEIDAATKARIAEFDKGPSTVDVSKYPKGIQENYRVFRQKCSLCHTLSRPVNSDFVLPDEWSRYVKRMMHKPGSMINATDAKKIYAYLVYDVSVRKQAALDAKLAPLSAADKEAVESKIKEVHAEYDEK